MVFFALRGSRGLIAPEFMAKGEPPEYHYTPSELAAAHPGHDHVGDHQFNGRGMRFADHQRLHAVPGLQYFVAMQIQDVTDQFADRLFVFHQQDRFRAA